MRYLCKLQQSSTGHRKSNAIHFVCNQHRAIALSSVNCICCAQTMAPLLLASMQQRSTLGRVAGVLFAFGAVMLLLEASSLDYRHYSSRLFTRRNGRDLSGARDLAAMDLDADDGRDDATLPLWLQKQHDDRDVPADELMHLSLLHAACLAFGDAVIPWTYGAPGVNQENDADNAKVLLHRDDPDLLERLRQCPEIDIFIPTGLRGHGYCEDAVVYAKCT